MQIFGPVDSETGIYLRFPLVPRFLPIASVLVLTVSLFLLHDSVAIAEDKLIQIAESWGRIYTNFPDRAAYHYRSTIDTVRLKMDKPLGDEVSPFHEGQYGVEIFRFAGATRSHTIRGHNFAVPMKDEWVQVFDGEAAYVIQGEAHSYSVNTTSQKVEDLMTQGLPYFDPLADVLGLSARVSVPSWRIGAGTKHPFDIETALKTRDYRLVSDDGATVALVADYTDRLILSCEHDYAIKHRTWHWDVGKSVKCTIENSGWKQFSDGTWYPSNAVVTYFGEPTTSPNVPCLRVQMRFTALAPTTNTDFEIIADRTGWTIDVFSPDNRFRQMIIQEGEAINLLRVAKGEVTMPIPVESRDFGSTKLNSLRMLVAIVITVFATVACFEILRSKRKKRSTH